MCDPFSRAEISSTIQLLKSGPFPRQAITHNIRFISGEYFRAMNKFKASQNTIRLVFEEMTPVEMANFKDVKFLESTDKPPVDPFRQSS